MTKQDGGPAFPYLRRYVGPDHYEALAEGGMSLRDWFAGQALANNYAFDADKPEKAAAWAYAIADAMLAARDAK